MRGEPTPASFRLRCRDRVLSLDAWSPRIMGILNVTPDSFYDGGRHQVAEAAIDHAMRMIREGADMLDVGGESTRPGSMPVPAILQGARVVPVIDAIRKRSDVFISVDTTLSLVAETAIKAGADIVNDTSGLADDPGMARVVSETGAAVVLMHRKGVPSTMQDNPRYDDFMAELVDSLARSVRTAIEAGIASDRIVVDPGVGFGKRLQDNLEIHRSLRDLESLAMPILFGSSRKSFLGQLSGKDVDARLAGTIASNVIAAWQGAHILRVHDVAEVREAVQLVAAVRSGNLR